MLVQLRKAAWLVVEAAFVLVVLCVLLNIILGAESGPFIAGVANNATTFLQRIPPGSFLGLVLILVLFWLYKARRP